MNLSPTIHHGEKELLVIAYSLIFFFLLFKIKSPKFSSNLMTQTRFSASRKIFQTLFLVNVTCILLFSIRLYFCNYYSTIVFASLGHLPN